jgi:thioredoxin reductase (NADPH)
LIDNGDRPELAPQRNPYLLESNVPGIFVAADMRQGSIKGAACSVGEVLSSSK